MCSTSEIGSRAIQSIYRFPIHAYNLQNSPVSSIHHRAAVSPQALILQGMERPDSSHLFHLYFSREDAEEGLRLVVLMLCLSCPR